MVFSSIVFLCMFLPIVCISYFLLPKQLRNIWLLVFSLLFYAYGEPIYICIMAFSTIFDYANGRAIDYCKRKGKKWAKAVLVLSIVGNLGMLGYFKYTDFLLGSINQMTGSDFSLLSLALPIGISFYTFQTMSYTIDVYLGKVQCQKNFVDFAMYVCFFPQLIAGPIVKYSCVEHQLKNRNVTLEMAAQGLSRFSIGLGKKVLLANQAGALYEQIKGFQDGDWSMAVAWLGAISYMFQIYFDFSGYSDMAIGLGSMFGFSFPENFKHPYESKSITEFWRRWHISLGTWFKEYVYIPLGGNRKGFGRQILNISIVWLLTGLWHGAYGNFVVWGIYYGILLMIEKLLWKPVFSGLPSFFMHLYTMFFVILGWGIFSWQDMADGTNYFKTLFGISGNFVNREAMYLLSSYLILLVIAIIGSVSLLRTCINRFFLPEKTMRREVCGMLFVVVVFILSVALLVNSSYNPFLYFRF